MATRLSRPREIAEGYEAWLTRHFPHVASQPLSERHHGLWRWFEALGPDTVCEPRVECWPRGGAKSSTVELGCAYLAARRAKQFVLYVCETQDQANRHVQAVATLLERLGFGPAVNREGHLKGWRRDVLRCASGFNLAGIGLDVAIRGVKLDEFRPDLIVLDDIDSRNDTPVRTRRKEEAITQGIFPTGASNTAILFVQNLIIEDGVMARVLDGRADYLSSATIRGPEKAVEALVTEDARLENGKRFKRVVGGVPTWAGQGLAVVQEQIKLWGWTAFKREAQHEVAGQDGFFFDAGRLAVVDEGPPMRRLVRAWDLAATQGGGDYTVGVLIGQAANGTFYVLDVKRHQFGSSRVRKLMRSTAERDRAGEIWAADEVDDTGLLVRPGEKRFEFRGPVSIRYPQDPAQAGKDQSEQLRQLLSPFGVAKAVSPSGKKAVRARGFADAVNDGQVCLVRGDWNHTFTEELRRFREDEQHDYDDQVDAACDAFNAFPKQSWSWDNL